MTAKEFLEQPLKLQKRLKYLELEKEHYTELMYSVRSVNYSEPKVDKSPSNTTPNMYGIMMLDETEEKIRVAEKEYEKACKEVSDKINGLEKDEYRLLLKYRYLEFKNMTEIANELFVSYATIKRWYLDAIKQIVL